MMSFAGCHGLGLSGMGFMGGGFLMYGILFLILILAAVYLFSNNNRSRHNQPEAIRILDSEYAKGNISDADYKKRKENLMH